jgi:hypothetical protein
MTGSRAINEIIVGHRHRRDLGDVDGLARSIEQIGLLHPVVVRSDGTLVAGGRRLAACRQLGCSEIPTTVVDLDEIAKGEFAANLPRMLFVRTFCQLRSTRFDAHWNQQSGRQRKRDKELVTTYGKLSRKLANSERATKSVPSPAFQDVR